MAATLDRMSFCRGWPGLASLPCREAGRSDLRGGADPAMVARKPHAIWRTIKLWR